MPLRIYMLCPLVSPLTTAPITYTAKNTAVKIASVMGKPLSEALDKVTSTGIEPPTAKPTFHDNPVPLARIAVGNLSLRKMGKGASTAFPIKAMISE